MKFTTLALAATLAGTSYAGASCRRRDDNAGFVYTIQADNVDDISGICGGLWDNLKRFWGAGCHAYGPTCGARGPGNPLYWEFGALRGCNTGMIESTWWEATRNRFGAIKC